MSYDHWRKRLEIAKLPTVAARREAVAALKINFSQPGEADEGYYRKPITEKHPTNGQNKIVGWVPVAYFMSDATSADGRELCGVIGAGAESRNMTDHEVTSEELWSWVVSNPISYEVYDAVVNHGDAWPDATPMQKAIAEGGRIEPYFGPGGVVGAPPDREILPDDNKPPELLPHVEHATAIDNAIGAAKDLKVTTADEAAVAAGAANIIRDRRLAAEKVAKFKVTPLQLAYEEERNNWLPLVKRAKDAEGVLRTAVSTFERGEALRVIKERQDALDRQREIDEANARAADRAIAAGEPEQPPVVEDVVIPQAPQRIQPTYGSYKPAAKQVRKFAVIVDDVAVYKYFATTADVQELLQKFANNAVRQGVEVPGTTVREGTE